LILKGIYVEDWKYSEKPPKNYDSIEEMKKEVKTVQKQYGEENFPWSKPTEEIISITLGSLRKFLDERQLEHLKDQLPKEIKKLVK